MKNCKFCLENNVIKGEILAENDYCYFVESIDSVLNCAGMIITKRHVETPFDLNDEEWGAIKEMLLKVKDILNKHNPSGFNIGWNVGEIAGQNVEHAHLHVIARFSDEPLSGKGIRYAFKQESNRRP